LKASDEPLIPTLSFPLLLALGFFFGLAFEEFHAQDQQVRPGGVRSFPLLGLSGALLYRLDTTHLLPLTAGLLVLGAWLTAYYLRHMEETDPEGRPNVGLMVPICNVLAYLLGPIALAEPPWVAIGVTVVAVLLLTAREKLHGFARRLEVSEIVTAGKFLILTGLVLPFLPNEPVTALTDITPHQVWLAVLAVCSISYASYLLQRYVAPAGVGWWVAILGGLYSSTATTIVLARRAATEPATVWQAQTGIILATAIMYVRLLVIVAIFNLPLAGRLAPAACLIVIWSGARRLSVLDERHANPVASRCKAAHQSLGTNCRIDLRWLVCGDLAGVGLGADPVWRRRLVRARRDRWNHRHRPLRAEHRSWRGGSLLPQCWSRRDPNCRLDQQPGKGGVCRWLWWRAGCCGISQRAGVVSASGRHRGVADSDQRLSSARERAVFEPSPVEGKHDRRIKSEQVPLLALVVKLRQQMPDQVEPSGMLVVGADDVPRRMFRVGP
jgi:hypothetical protein